MGGGAIIALQSVVGVYVTVDTVYLQCLAKGDLLFGIMQLILASGAHMLPGELTLWPDSTAP